MSRKLTLLAIFGSFFACALSASAQTAPEPVVAIAKLPAPALLAELDKTFYEFQVFELDLPTLKEQVSSGVVSLHLGNRTYDLSVDPNDLRGPGYRAVLLDGETEREVNVPMVTFAGHVVGESQSVVRLTVTRGLFMGYIHTGEEWLFIDPLNDYSKEDGAGRAPSPDVVVYRDRDVRPDASGLCGSDRIHQIARELDITPSNEPLTRGGRRVDVATDFDGQYFQQFGNPGSFNRINGIINAVDGIYRNQLNLDLNISFQQGWGNPSTDPYTSLSANTSLTQLRNWWNANRGNINRDITHKFSGKDFSGSTVGIAFVGVVCNAPGSAYGISQNQGSSFLRTQLTAHEIGHNFSANHDNQIGCPVSCNGSGPIMCSFLQSSGSNSFSSCSRNAIANHTNQNGFCLN